MPKLVDHSARRREIIHATWRLIAEHGIDGATMREIAREAGFANGALTHYFEGKDDLLRASFEFVYEETNSRIGAAMGDATGLAALRLFCLEVLPLDQTRLLEAKIVLPFWGRTTADPVLSAVNARAMAVWRGWILGYLGQAAEEGDIPDGTELEPLVDELLSALLGAQVVAVMEPQRWDGGRQLRMLDTLLARLRA
ncbi:TetR/AcrR family transcriptional regulator [Actinocorallia sp. A-T 12471]|uniref:TetR/AcrR family transcriptional regulator n=1 Tax=Actinocorallia sp. A-T 12471 TaxID=3089813 RepID=UPI0029CF1900|nr:TetR/AcrR family transcriptional regulator [Actinocorallia sp. A-T 12471]MDX6744118.1 TetR/AcrR family transcriptional regulator [Actinocorallia sp. A-T 12471]